MLIFLVAALLIGLSDATSALTKPHHLITDNYFIYKGKCELPGVTDGIELLTFGLEADAFNSSQDHSIVVDKLLKVLDQLYIIRGTEIYSADGIMECTVPMLATIALFIDALRDIDKIQTHTVLPFSVNLTILLLVLEFNEALKEKYVSK